MTSTEQTLDVTIKIRRSRKEKFRTFESEAIRDALSNLFEQMVQDLAHHEEDMKSGMEVQMDGTISNIIRNPPPPPPPPCKFKFNAVFA